MGAALQKAYLEVTEEGSEAAGGSGRSRDRAAANLGLSCSLSPPLPAVRNGGPEQDAGAVPAGHG